MTANQRTTWIAGTLLAALSFGGVGGCKDEKKPSSNGKPATAPTGGMTNNMTNKEKGPATAPSTPSGMAPLTSATRPSEVLGMPTTMPSLPIMPSRPIPSATSVPPLSPTGSATQPSNPILPELNK